MTSLRFVGMNNMIGRRDGSSDGLLAERCVLQNSFVPIANRQSRIFSSAIHSYIPMPLRLFLRDHPSRRPVRVMVRDFAKQNCLEPPRAGLPRMTCLLSSALARSALAKINYASSRPIGGSLLFSENSIVFFLWVVVGGEIRRLYDVRKRRTEWNGGGMYLLRSVRNFSRLAQSLHILLSTKDSESLFSMRFS